MLVGIIGYGKMGNLYGKHLQKLGVPFVSLDTSKTKTNATFTNIEELKSIPSKWIICTPTECHLESVKAILPFAEKILVEKPLCNGESIQDFRELALQNSQKIIASDIYGSNLLSSKLSYLVHSLRNKSTLQRICITFSKNRSKDESKGRFVDQYFYSLGYEGWHMLSVLRTVLSQKEFSSYLKSSSNFKFEHERKSFFEEVSVSEIPQIHLNSSVAQKKYLRLSKDFSKSIQKIQKKYNQNKKVSRGFHLQFSDFELHFLYGAASNNEHRLIFTQKDSQHSFILRFNQLLDFLERNLLSTKQKINSSLQLDEAFRFMDRLVFLRKSHAFE